MRTKLSDWTWWGATLAGVAVMGWLALQGFAWNNYDTEVSVAFKSLVEGNVGGFLTQIPAYGGSLVLRAPFAGIAAALGGGELAVYRAVSIPCLVAVAVLGIFLVRRLDGRGRSRGVRALVLGLCLANPITIRALEIGHPEELLCAAFAIGALLAAIDGRVFFSTPHYDGYPYVLVRLEAVDPVELAGCWRTPGACSPPSAS